MPDLDNQSLVGLPKSTESWVFGIKQLRSWIRREDQSPYRPYILLIMDARSELILYTSIDEEVSVERAQEALFSAMLRPRSELKVIPYRPDQVKFSDRKLMEALKPALEEIDVRAGYIRSFPLLNQFTRELEDSMREDYPEIPGLLAQRSVTPLMVGDLFTAAAAFYRTAPWVQLSNDDILTVQVSGQKDPYYVIVMGQGGVNYGLALYKSWQEFVRWLAIDGTPDGRIPLEGIQTLFFNDITEVPGADLDAIEKYGWELADSQAYPVPMIFTEDELKRPGRDDILWYQAALLAIPIFVCDHLVVNADNSLQESVAQIPVQITDGEVTVTIRYRHIDIPDRRSSDQMIGLDEDDYQLELPFDRRAIEGDIASIYELLDIDELDPKLKKAQELMYQAWDETNPARRLVMAHKALKISPDCSDAYVLLAEEEADSTKNALDLYKKGIQAGRRALGEAYFQENVGHFWGLLETRPFMRALQGAAECLWQLGSREEALQIYKEMLRLNPGDNQGIRYALVDLYLTLNREQDLVKLLGEYEDDYTAVWLYTQALMAFRREGASPGAILALDAALEQNAYVPAYLTGRKRVPSRLPETIGWGDEKEAVVYAADHLNYWRRTPGSIAWLEERSSK